MARSRRGDRAPARHSASRWSAKSRSYIISAGGKRLRPALLLLLCGALGYRGPQRFDLAAVVEFIHTATLLHDDVVDESTLRRGRADRQRVLRQRRPACWSATSCIRAPSR